MSRDDATRDGSPARGERRLARAGNARLVMCASRGGARAALAMATRDATARALVVASEAHARMWCEAAISSGVGDARCACETQGGVKRLAAGGARGSRLDATRRDRAAVALARDCDVVVVDVEDERGVDATVRACALAARAVGTRVVIARSPAMTRALAATASDDEVDFFTAMTVADETEEASANELWGNTWANDFVERGDLCRFHNYAERGCEKRAEACALNHETCAYCDENGHRAYECEVLIAHARSARVLASRSLREACEAAAGTFPLGERHRERLRADATTSTKPYIYVMGGRNRGLTVGVVERYDVLENKWERAPKLIEPRGSHGACAVGTTLYVVSGGGCKSNLSSMETLDASNPDAAWTMHEDVVQPRHAMGSVSTSDGKIYTVGGWFNGCEALASTDIFDCEKKSWSKGAPMKFARRLHGVCASDDGFVYVFGGLVNEETSTAERYDPAADEWTEIASLPFPACTTACAIGSDCFVFSWGTKSVRGDSATKGGFYRYDARANAYEPLPELPLKEWFGFTVCAHAGVLYAIGGIVKGKWIGRAFAYHVTERAWEEVASMCFPRRRTAAAVVELPRLA